MTHGAVIQRPHYALNGVNNMLKNIWGRVIILIILAVILIIGRSALNHLEREKQIQSTVFELDLPLPEKIAKQYDIEPNPNLNNVILSGFFTDWSWDSEHYEMKQTQTNHWELSLDLPPGDYQYQYLLHIITDSGETQSIWIHDHKTLPIVEDNFGSYYSHVIIPDYSRISFLFQLIVSCIIALIFFFSMIEILSLQIFKVEMTIRQRMMMVISLMVIILSVATILFNISTQRTLTRQGYIDSINMIHQYLQTGETDFENINEPQTQITIDNELDAYFENVQARVSKTRYTSRQLMVAIVIVMNTNFDIIAHSGHNESMNMIDQIGNQMGYTQPATFYEEVIFSNLISQIQESGKIIHPLYGETETKKWAISDELIPDEQYLPGFSLSITPIMRHQQVIGYYGGAFQNQLYQAEMRRGLIFTIILSVVILIMTMIYFFYIPRPSHKEFKWLSPFFTKYHITHREEIITYLLMKGYTYQSIADKLFLSLTTIKTRIANIFHKVGVENRNELKQEMLKYKKPKR